MSSKGSKHCKKNNAPNAADDTDSDTESKSLADMQNTPKKTHKNTTCRRNTTPEKKDHFRHLKSLLHKGENQSTDTSNIKVRYKNEPSTDSSDENESTSIVHNIEQHLPKFSDETLANDSDSDLEDTEKGSVLRMRRRATQEFKTHRESMLKEPLLNWDFGRKMEVEVEISEISGGSEYSFAEEEDDDQEPKTAPKSSLQREIRNKLKRAKKLIKSDNKKDGSKSRNRLSSTESNLSVDDLKEKNEIESAMEMLEETQFQDALSHENVVGTPVDKASSLTMMLESSSHVQLEGSSESFQVLSLRAIYRMRILIAAFTIALGYLYFAFSAPVLAFCLGVMMTMIINLCDARILGSILSSLNLKGSERSQFELPNYSEMPMLKVPSCEDLGIIRRFEGWMNLYELEYSPETYHLSDTKSVFIKVKGSTLRMSFTNAKIPKRSIYKEKIRKPKLTSHQYYDLAGARVTLLPEGLTRKRHFSKKYPLCIEFQNQDDDELTKHVQMYGSAPSLHSMASIVSKESVATVIDDYAKQINVNDNQSMGSIVEERHPDDVEGSKSSMFDAALDEVDSAEGWSGLTTKEYTKILLFARASREKYDWYTKLIDAIERAGMGEIVPIESISSKKQLVADGEPIMSESTIKNEVTANRQTAESHSRVTMDIDSKMMVNPTSSRVSKGTTVNSDGNNASSSSVAWTEGSVVDLEPVRETGPDIIQGLEIRGPIECIGDQSYIRYMAHFQQIHPYQQIPPFYPAPSTQAEINASGKHKKSSKVTRAAANLWRNVDRTINNDMVWANALMGRIILGVLTDPGWTAFVQEKIQKKLSTIRLPIYIDEIICTELRLGNTPPLLHRSSRPVLDERGLWVDIDVTYEGLIQAVLKTKLDLMKLKKVGEDDNKQAQELAKSKRNPAMSAIYNSDVEDSAETSTTEDERKKISSSEPEHSDTNDTAKTSHIGTISVNLKPKRQNSKALLRIVDRIAASNFFKHATENKFIKKAMVAVSNSQIKLQLDIRGLVGIIVVNIPPPPGDRMWISFREPPRLWLSAHPAVGERSLSWSHITSWIERKICQELIKTMVMPNMMDIANPLLVPLVVKETTLPTTENPETVLEPVK